MSCLGTVLCFSLCFDCLAGLCVGHKILDIDIDHPISGGTKLLRMWYRYIANMCNTPSQIQKRQNVVWSYCWYVQYPFTDSETAECGTVVLLVCVVPLHWFRNSRMWYGCIARVCNTNVTDSETAVWYGYIASMYNTAVTDSVAAQYFMVTLLKCAIPLSLIQKRHSMVWLYC